MDDDRQGLMWRAMGAAAGLGAGLLARRVLETAWRATRGQDPPSNPASSDTRWGEALLWAAVSGVVVAVIRLVAERGAAEAWRAATGDYPENLDDVRA